MSFSEKDNLEVNQDVQETESTIFADPAHYNEKQRESKEKNRKSPIGRWLFFFCIFLTFIHKLFTKKFANNYQKPSKIKLFLSPNVKIISKLTLLNT